MSWLSGYGKRITLNINSSLITVALTHFPIYVNLSNSSGITGADVTDVFDVVGNNLETVAFTESDGVTRLYCEVVSWNETTKTAELWVSSSTWVISDSTTTTLFLYYGGTVRDSTYIGWVGSAAAEAVWDANFKLVSHMNDDPDTSHIADSTSNGNDGTKTASNEPIIDTGGKIGSCQLFDGLNDLINTADITVNAKATFEAWIKPTALGNYEFIYKNDEFLLRQSSTFFVFFGNDGTWKNDNSPAHSNINNWSYVAGVWDGTVVEAFSNGVGSGTPAAVGAVTDTANHILIGAALFAAAFVGYIDEVRVSDIDRSDAWVGASYETQRDHLITYSTPEPEHPQSRTWKPTPQIFTKKERILIEHREAFKKFIEFLKVKRGIN